MVIDFYFQNGKHIGKYITLSNVKFPINEKYIICENVFIPFMQERCKNTDCVKLYGSFSYNVEDNKFVETEEYNENSSNNL
jgi:hypothetical protein